MVAPSAGAVDLVPFPFSDFASGSLHLASFARPGKLFTASRDLMTASVGQLRPVALERTLDAIVALLRPRAGGARRG